MSKLIAVILTKDGGEKRIKVKKGHDSVTYKDCVYSINLNDIKVDKAGNRKIYFMQDGALPVSEASIDKNVSGRAVKQVGEDLPRLFSDLMKDEIQVKDIILWVFMGAIMIMQLVILWKFMGSPGAGIV